MARMLDLDPWNWTVADVKHWFKHEASSAIAGQYPHPDLPSLPLLLQKLSENDIDGATLLDSVPDPRTIKEELGISSMGQQGKIMHCIRTLRRRSQGYKRLHDEPSGMETPMSTTRHVEAAASPLPSATTPVLENVGDHTRSGETTVDDGNGRKRRRLNLLANNTTNDATDHSSHTLLNTHIRNANDKDRFLPSTKQPIDELMFGTVSLGKPIGPQRVTHPAFVDEGDGDMNDAWQFVNTATVPGMAGYAYARMWHFLTTRREVTITRKNRDALAVYPYREGLQRADATTLGTPTKHGRLAYQGTQSVLVIQAAEGETPTGDDEDDGRLVAIRENDSMLQSHAMELGYTVDEAAEMTGEYDHLLQHWGNQADDHIVDSDDDDDDDDDSGETIVTDTENSDDLAEEEDQSTAEPLDVEATINQAMARMREQWQNDKLPAVERKDAGTTWRRMKRSHAIQTVLVQGARSTIHEFDQRLAKYKRDLLLGDWDSEASLLKMCDHMLEPTVHDREHQLWKISVWQSRREPVRKLRTESAHATTSTAPALTQGGSEMHTLLQGLGPGDRIEFSPQPDVLPSTELKASSTAMDVDAHGDERFFTPPPVQQAEDEPSLASDDADMADVSRQSSPGSDFVVQDEADSDGQIIYEDNISEGSLGSGDVAMHDTARELLRPSDPDSAQTPVTPTKQNGVKLSPSSDPQTPEVKPESDLPNPMTGGRPRIKAQVIDLVTDTSSSHTPKKLAPKGLKRKREANGRQTPKPRKRKLRPATQIADDARASEVDEWDYEELTKNKLRRHLLIKLMRDTEQAFLRNAHSAFQSLMRKGVLKNIATALQIIAGMVDKGDVTFQSLPSSQQDTLKHCALLACAWWENNPDVMLTRTLSPKTMGMIVEGGKDFDDFVTQIYDNFRPLLVKRESQLFVGHKKTSFAAPQEISSDAEGDPGDVDEEIPWFSRLGSAKKRKKVMIDQTAKKTRATAQDRQQRFQDMQSQYNSNPSQLQAMIAADLSQSNSLDINPMRDDGQPGIHIDSKIAQAMKDYQIEGARFMWTELTADNDEDGSQGCLLAHTMGLGKTMQSVALMVAVDEASMSRLKDVRRQLPRSLRTSKDERLSQRRLRLLVICPPTLLQNWRREIEQWAPPHAFGGRKPLTLDSVGGEKAGPTDKCMNTLETWSAKGGILLLGYSIMRSVLKERISEEMTEDWTTAHRILYEETSLVVADEAHALKNVKSQTAKVAAKFKTQSRIALTGTPMSNNVEEIYALISWVAPGFLGNPREFSGRFSIPIRDGLYQESTREERSRGLVRLKVLHKEIAPKVNRANIQVLKGSLKPKMEFVLTVELTEVQRLNYAKYVKALWDGGLEVEAGTTRIFNWLAVLQLLTNHPACYRAKLLAPPPKKTGKGRKKSMSALEDAANAVDSNDEVDDATPGKAEVQATSPGEAGEDAAGDEDLGRLGFSKSMIDSLLEDLEESEDPALSAKTSILLHIINLSRQCGDKLLVFSLSIPSLDYLGGLFRSNNISFGRIDGSMAMSLRNNVLQQFANGKYSILLISTRAGGQGLNIQGANRVVIFDFGFNPSWEEQAVGRAYRLGQTKPVFVYRFVAGGTFEANIDNKQMFKQGLAQRVVDKKATLRNAKRDMAAYLYEPTAIMHKDVEQWLGKDPHVLDKILARQLERTSQDREGADICDIRQSETLQEDEEEMLTAEETRLVEEEIALGPSKSRKALVAGELNGLAPAAAGMGMGMGMGASILSTAPAMAAAAKNRTPLTQVARAHGPGRLLSSTQAPPGAAIPSPILPIQTHGHGHGAAQARQVSFGGRDVRFNHTQGVRQSAGTGGSSPEFDGLPAPPSGPR